MLTGMYLFSSEAGELAARGNPGRHTGEDQVNVGAGAPSGDTMK